MVKKLLFTSLFPVLIGILVFGSTGCDIDGDEEGPNNTEIVISAILALDSPTGASRIGVLEEAVDQINLNGGVLDGVEIVLDIRSSEPPTGQSREEYAGILAQTVLEDNSNLVGYFTVYSSVARGVNAAVADPQHIPQISGTSTSDANSGLSEYFHRMAPSDKYQAEIAAQKLLDYGIDSIAIAIQGGDSYSEGLALVLSTAFESLGGTVTDTVNFTEDDPDLPGKITRLYANSPDAVYTAMLTFQFDFLAGVDANINNTGQPVDSLRFVFADAQQTTGMLTTVREEFLVGEVNGNPKSFGTAPFPDTQTENYLAFLDMVAADVVAFDANCFDGIFIFALAIEAALANGASINDIVSFREAVNQQIRIVSRSDDGDSVVRLSDGWSEIKTTAQSHPVDYDGASGNCNIDENGDVITNYNIWRVIKEGEELKFEILENIDPTGS